MSENESSERQSRPVEALVGPVDAAMALIFDKPREQRSDAYKEGVRATLKKHYEGISIAEQCSRYRKGSAELDAFFAGTDEGRLHVGSGLLPNAV